MSRLPRSWCPVLVLSVLLTTALQLAADDRDRSQTAKPSKQTPKDQPSKEASAKKKKKSANKKAKKTVTDLTPVEKVVASATESVVVVTFTGRDGKQQGLGSGFIISPDGLIATNLHVIGEGRPIKVQLASGKQYDVKTIYATERVTDLALLRIEANKLPALKLGDSDQLKQGQRVVAIGNPLGLKHSVVTGVVSGRREIDGKSMIQLAIPIEQGNSGGPLLDLSGRVHGILTLKSLVTKNLGFAVAGNALKPLLKKPNPIPMSRWLTIGSLDKSEWKPLFEAHWRQRAGRILVEGRGQGFGGRSLCLSTIKVPDKPFEVAVTVKMKQADGAAGLAFYADGNQKHYGFYPSSGRLRLSRFDGPDVYSWKVLKEIQSDHYRPGDWNTLKIRLDKDKIQCFINGHAVIESTDSRYRQGQVGLAKFRHTEAEFKSFRVAKNIPSTRPSAESVARITKLVEDISPRRPPKSDLIDQVVKNSDNGATVLRERAQLLEQQAQRLRQLAAAVHRKKVQMQLSKLLKEKEEQTDLLHAALLISQLDNDEVDVEAYRREVDRMVKQLAKSIPKDADGAAKLDALNKFLFQELGFHGSRTNYYNRSNSYLNEVIDDREGLPIALSVLYIEIARRAGLKVVGVGLPGHFVVRYEPDKGDGQLIDVFDGGAKLTRQQAAEKVKSITGRPLKDEHLQTTTKKAIIVRMLSNLFGSASEDEARLHYADTIVAADPDGIEFRALRIDLQIRTGRIEEALTDIDWMLKKKPPGMDVRKVRELRRNLEANLK